MRADIKVNDKFYERTEEKDGSDELGHVSETRRKMHDFRHDSISHEETTSASCCRYATIVGTVYAFF